MKDIVINYLLIFLSCTPGFALFASTFTMSAVMRKWYTYAQFIGNSALFMCLLLINLIAATYAQLYKIDENSIMQLLNLEYRLVILIASPLYFLGYIVTLFKIFEHRSYKKWTMYVHCIAFSLITILTIIEINFAVFFIYQEELMRYLRVISIYAFTFSHLFLALQLRKSVKNRPLNISEPIAETASEA